MRRILKASAIMGLSSVFTVALSVVRYKMLALHLGAEGVGLLGLLVTALALGVTLFSLGLGNSGVRQVAAAQAEGEAQGAAARTALIRGTWYLGLLSLIVGLLLAPLVGPTLLPGTPGHLTLWLVVAVAASVVSSGQVALLNGSGHLSAIAKANALGALIGTVLTVMALSASSSLGLPAALAATPLATLLLTTWYVRPLQKKRPIPSGLLWKTLKPMVLLGIAFSASVILSSITQLLVRVLIRRELGLSSVGYFQAAWTVASVYLGFVLNAMAAEYYPRISAIAQDTRQLNAQVNMQVRIALLLAAPIILLLMLLSPFIISVMYAKGFSQAADLLRWLLVGDLLKVASWPVGFLLLAREAKRAFFLVELGWNLVFLIACFCLLQTIGLQALGVAYIVAYSVYLSSVLFAGRRLTNYVIDKRVMVYLAYVFGIGLAVNVFGYILVDRTPLIVTTSFLLLFIIVTWILFSPSRRLKRVRSTVEFGESLEGHR